MTTPLRAQNETALTLKFTVLGGLAGIGLTMGALMVADGHVARGIPVMASATGPVYVVWDLVRRLQDKSFTRDALVSDEWVPSP